MSISKISAKFISYVKNKCYVCIEFIDKHASKDTKME